MMDRSIPPVNHKLGKPHLLSPKKTVFSNCVTSYSFNSPGSQIIQVEFVFSGGQLLQTKPLQASLTGQMLTEGTSQFSSKEIAEKIDFYGASLQIETDLHHLTLVVYATIDAFKELAHLIIDILDNPAFSEKEFSILKNTLKEQFKVKTKKVDYLSRQQFNGHLYGFNTNLGHKTTLNDYDQIDINDLKNFFHSFTHHQLEHVLVCGDLTTEVMDKIKLVSTFFNPETITDKPQVTIALKDKIVDYLPVQDAIQSSIRIGYKAIPRQHEDFPALQVVNMILGGYFGSRLMTNIREDKGYTYGIGSSVISLPHDGYLTIATEVGADVTNAALKEIYHEINRLCTDPVPAQELELARNYLIGSFIRNSDGVFAMMDRFKAIFYNNIDYSYYDHYFNVVESISAMEIQQIAKQYFDKPHIEVVAGGKG